MKILRVIMVFLLLAIVVSCIEKTSTSEEYLNKNKVSQETYLSDTNILQNVVASYIDSTNKIRKPKPKSKTLSIEIDTIFYGSNNKLALLYISKNKNPYVVANKDSLQFIGGCLIAIKDQNNSIKIVDKLKYITTTSETSNEISRDLRLMYLREMGYIEGKYNINDNRFWESDVWK
jgi:hypothetical protein